MQVSRWVGGVGKYVGRYVGMHVCVNTCACVYIYIYTHTYMYTSSSDAAKRTSRCEKTEGNHGLASHGCMLCVTAPRATTLVKRATAPVS